MLPEQTVTTGKVASGQGLGSTADADWINVGIGLSLGLCSYKDLLLSGQSAHLPVTHLQSNILKDVTTGRAGDSTTMLFCAI